MIYFLHADLLTLGHMTPYINKGCMGIFHVTKINVKTANCIDLFRAALD